MSKSKLKVGIVGVGGIAENKHLPALAKLSDRVDVVAFCDIIEHQAEKNAKKYGVKDAKTYTDYQKMFAHEKLDAVHVLTPNVAHSEIAVAAMEAGAHVICEKPMAKTAAGARAMLEASKRTGKLLTIAYQNRYRPDTLYLRKLVQDGELGEIYYAKAHAIRRRGVPTWGVFLNEEAQGGGPLIDIGTHALDLTLWCMDNYDVDYVVGTSYKKLGKRPGEANQMGPWNPAKYTVEDSAFGFVRMKNGATVTLDASWAVNLRISGEGLCTLCGTEAGADMMDGLHINGSKNGRLYDTKVSFDQSGVMFYDGPSTDPTDIEANTFYDAITKGTPLTVLPEQALVVSEILEAIYASSASGKPVYF